MRGLYENQWQEAMAGAVIQPSDNLWDNIASRLDKDKGRHNWVTILLIAATVTVAFAFPLTIGNSELESQENIQPSITQTDKNNATKIEDEKLLAGETDEALNESKLDQEAISEIDVEEELEDNTATLISKSTQNEKSQEKLINSANNQSLSTSTSITVSSSSTAKYGLSSIDFGNTLTFADIDSYYFIPYYLPAGESANRNMLASLNMGTGSLSAKGDFGSFGMNSAEFAQAPDGLNNVISDDRVENPGSTYYFGAGMEMSIGKRWSILAGVGYLAQKASGTSNIVLDAGNGNQPLGAYDPIVPGTIFLSESYNYSVTNSYINVPITFKYPFVNRKIKFRGGVGISTDFMISHTLNSDTYGKASYKPASMDYRTVVLAGLINLDISYSLSNQYSVALETGWRKDFTAIDVSKDYYPSSFTIGLILFYKIK